MEAGSDFNPVSKQKGQDCKPQDLLRRIQLWIQSFNNYKWTGLEQELARNNYYKFDLYFCVILKANFRSKQQELYTLTYLYHANLKHFDSHTHHGRLKPKITDSYTAQNTSDNKKLTIN